MSSPSYTNAFIFFELWAGPRHLVRLKHNYLGQNPMTFFNFIKSTWIQAKPEISMFLFSVMTIRNTSGHFCSRYSAINSTNEIIDWCAAFGVPNILMSDGPTHFRNKTILLFTRDSIYRIFSYYLISPGVTGQLKY